jgi:hypothetical protein
MGVVRTFSQGWWSKFMQLSPQRSLIDFYYGGAPMAFIVEVHKTLGPGLLESAYATWKHNS